ncbi:MAG: hypothetical protein WDZ41_00575 [Candidatus Babeliales bacterium]
MKKIYLFLAFGLINNLYTDMQASLKDNYSLVIKLQDEHQQEVVIIIPGDEISKNSIHIPQDRYTYLSSFWHEVNELWEDLSRPEDIGCYAILGHQVKGNNIEYVSPFDPHNSISITFDSPMQFIEGTCVLNELLQECSVEKYRIKKAIQKRNIPSYEFDDYFDQEDEIEMNEFFAAKSEPSNAVIYARQIGVILFLKYLIIKDYVSNQWSSVKKYITKRFKRA